MLKQLIGKLATDGRGNVGIIMALVTGMMIFTLGMGVDYNMAAKRRARLNAAADAAVLSTLTPAAMAKTRSIALADAKNFFAAQVASIPGVSNVSDPQFSGSDSPNGLRNVSLTYTAKSSNVFGGFFRAPTFAIGGTATASAAQSPNIDFYLLLDTSPSMAIPATQSGIDAMVAATQNGNTLFRGCAFACHEANPVDDNLGNPGGPNQDRYEFATKVLGIPVRMDVVRQAVQNVMDTMKDAASRVGATYRVAGYTFDVAFANPIALTSDLSSAKQQAANIQILQVWNEIGNMLTKTIYNNDQDTDFDQAFSKIIGEIPPSGNGTNVAGDTPQKVLIIVTDGVADQPTNGARYISAFGANETSYCDQLKNKGIRIGVLYTTYVPLPMKKWDGSNSYYADNVASVQPTIASTAQNCASPGLYVEVGPAGNISDALNGLFKTAAMPAHLTQ